MANEHVDSYLGLGAVLSVSKTYKCYRATFFPWNKPSCPCAFNPNVNSCLFPASFNLNEVSGRVAHAIDQRIAYPMMAECAQPAETSTGVCMPLATRACPPCPRTRTWRRWSRPFATACAIAKDCVCLFLTPLQLVGGYTPHSIDGTSERLRERYNSDGL